MVTQPSKINVSWSLFGFTKQKMKTNTVSPHPQLYMYFSYKLQDTVRTY